MSEERGTAVRPAGAPMVPRPGPAVPSTGGPEDEPAGDGAEQAVAPVVEQAKEAGTEVAQQARRRAQDEVDRRTTEAGERLAGTAADLREIAEGLRAKDKETPARLASQAADRIERLGSYLREADLDRLSGDLGRIARRRPAVLLVGAAAAGVLAGRLIKASEPSRSADVQGARWGSR
jgi:hypothetical protein